MKRPPNPPIPGQMLERSQDLFEILGEIMGKLDLLAERIEGIECQLNMQEKCGQPSTTSVSSTLTEDTLDELEATISVPHPTAITIVNHATPRHGSQMRVNPTIEVPAHIGRSGSATSAPPLGSYHHLSAPSTPQRQIPRSPRGGYQPQEEPFPSTPQTILTQARRIPTPQQAASRLEVDQARITGPPFFVVFNGSEPGVFTDWPFVLRTCKWRNGDWKKYETRSAALQVYEDAYMHGGLKFSERL